MRVLIISDIHANLTALETVLEHTEEFDAAWFLGDLVGYGPDPNECVQRLQSLPNVVALTGNHDVAVSGEINIDAFNVEARRVIQWTRDTITQENLEYLRGLPSKIQVDENITLTHGSPREPIWEYVLDPRTATENFASFETPYCMVGHTHVSIIFHLRAEANHADYMVPSPGDLILLEPRAILNPGSVGQPRDGDPRAAYALFDTESQEIEYRRVEYDIPAVQARMRKAGLPGRHIQRLEVGR